MFAFVLKTTIRFELRESDAPKSDWFFQKQPKYVGHKLKSYAFTFCFPNTDHVMTLKRFDPLSCSSKKSTCRHIRARQKIKSLEYYHMVCIGKTKCSSEKVLLTTLLSFYKGFVCEQLLAKTIWP